MKPVKVFKTVVQDEIIPCVDRMEFQTMNLSKFVDREENFLIEDNHIATRKVSPVRCFCKATASEYFDVEPYIEETFVVFDPPLEDYVSILIKEKEESVSQELHSKYGKKLSEMESEKERHYYEKEMLKEYVWSNRQTALKLMDLECRFLGVMWVLLIVALGVLFL